MLKKLVYLCLIIFGLLLLGCDRQTNEAYLLRHPAKFKTILQQCVTISKNQIKQYPQCELAVNLYGQVLRLTRELFNSPEQYGKDILSLQIKRGQLEEQMAKVRRRDRQSYKNQIYQINREIKVRLALLAQA
ncbi:MAG: hypothetical protein PVG30_05220 [Gammaproteobacteria bacterium]|jgi:hypothetical protein